MVHIVMFRARPKWQDMMQTPWELVPTVRINGLKQPTYDPQVHGQDMQIARDGAPDKRRAYAAEAQNQDFDGGGVFGGHAKGGAVLVVDFVDVFVERTPVERAVGPVVPGIFKQEEDGDLVGHGEEGWEGNASDDPAKLGQGVEEPASDVRIIGAAPGRR